jgi:hypothetical protein
MGLGGDNHCPSFYFIHIDSRLLSGNIGLASWLRSCWLRYEGTGLQSCFGFWVGCLRLFL